MSILTRISKIFQAKVQKAVEKAEGNDPVALIKVDLNKAKEQLAEFESATTKLGGTKISLEKKVKEIKADIKDWHDKAVLAMEEGKESLAEKALEREAELDAELECIKSSLDKTSKQYENMKAKVLDRKKVLQQKERELVSLQARQEAAKLNQEMRNTVSGFEGSDSALDRIDSLSKKVDDMENIVEAADDMEESDGDAKLEKEFATLENKTNVSDKMAKLKSEMKKK